MAASTTSGFPVPLPSSVSIPKAATGLRTRPRRISPAAGHALEILGHAIEYLSDELVHEGLGLSTHDARVEALQLLMALNRQIYFECPEIPTIGERCRKLVKDCLS